MPTWLVTGSSSGLGLGIVRYVLSQGHNVIATSRNPTKTPDLVKEVTSHPNGRWMTLDVTFSGSEVAQILQQAWDEFGSIDVLVNNAGYSILGAAEDIPEAGAKDQFEVNFWGAVRTSQAVLPLMRKRKSGTIINISSVAGADALATCSIYAASKAALESWTESLDKEVRLLGIRAFAVQPGGFRTNFFSSSAMLFVPTGEGYTTGSTPVAKVLDKFRCVDPTSFGDPLMAGQRILEVVTRTGVGARLPDDVVRIPLGDDCYARVKDSFQKREKELQDVWEVAHSIRV